ncbi:MAG: RNA polymerase sigma factor [Firmicutes bacterium]|nr:RNA polymerase sigma factor [Bacillota bacterium]
MNRNVILDKVFREEKRKIIYAIKKAGCPDQDMEDVFHQTLLTALENFDQLSDPSKAAAWCISIAVNITRRKTERDKKVYIIDFYKEEHHPDLPEEAVYDVTQDEIENADLRMDLKRLLEKISPEFAIPLQLKVIYGFTYEEIAVIMGVKAGTVRSRINRAKRLLEKAIKNERKTSEG